MYRIKQIRPGKEPLYLGYQINGKNVWWENAKYAKPFMNRKAAEVTKRHLMETKERNVQLHIEPIT